MILDHPIQAATSLQFSWPEEWSQKGELHALTVLCYFHFSFAAQPWKFLLLKSFFQGGLSGFRKFLLWESLVALYINTRRFRPFFFLQSLLQCSHYCKSVPIIKHVSNFTAFPVVEQKCVIWHMRVLGNKP